MREADPRGLPRRRRELTLRLLFDALAIGDGPSGTRSRLLGLAPALAGRGFDVGVLHGPALDDEARERLGSLTLLCCGDPPGSPLARWRRQHRILHGALSQFRCDAVVSEALPWPAVPLVGTVHDLRQYGEAGLRGLIAKRAWGASLARARVIHAVSAAVAAELRSRHPVAAKRLHVVPNAFDDRRFAPVADSTDAAALARHGVAPPFILCVGHLEARKGCREALRIRAEIAQRGANIPVVFVGRGPLPLEPQLAALRARFPSHDPGRVLRDVATDELPAFYRAATVVLAPALYEGFGIAPLEALACGAVVVASDIPPHREILGDAAVFVDVRQPGAATDAVLHILREGEGITARRQRAIARAQRWTWHAAAEAFEASLASFR